MGYPWDRRARRYSTARALLGRERHSPALVISSNACCRAAGKDIPFPVISRSFSENAACSSPSAAASRGSSAPHSHPKAKWVTTPAAASAAAAPWAKRSAPAAAHGVGSSSTRSTPPTRAISARLCLFTRAKSPRWTKFPLMQATTAVSAPRRRRISAACQAWPRWKGLYSAITPATATFRLLRRPAKNFSENSKKQLPGRCKWSTI